MSDAEQWRDERARNVAARAEVAARALAAETARAQTMIDEFVTEAGRRGITPGPLHARGRGGKGRYRTDLVGWYVKRDETVAIGTDGRYHLMFTAGGVGERLAGASIPATEPPLIVGKGGRDGESIDLPEALRLRLEQG